MLYSSWTKWVLSEHLKQMSDFALCMWSGSLFQSTGPAFAKAWSSPVTRDVGSSTNIWSSKELEHTILPGLVFY